MSYDFYNYVLKLENGDVKLNGNLTVSNTFPPVADGVLCNTLVKSLKVADSVNSNTIEIVILSFLPGLVLEGKLIHAAGAGLLVNIAPAFSDKINEPSTKEIMSDDRTITANFKAYELSMRKF
tara:strand:- start:541 stop:909 length:369 start_codon:yes stop_codon:yes gene_type:complete